MGGLPLRAGLPLHIDVHWLCWRRHINKRPRNHKRRARGWRRQWHFCHRRRRWGRRSSLREPNSGGCLNLLHPLGQRHARQNRCRDGSWRHVASRRWRRAAQPRRAAPPRRRRRGWWRWRRWRRWGRRRRCPSRRHRSGGPHLWPHSQVRSHNGQRGWPHDRPRSRFHQRQRQIAERLRPRRHSSARTAADLTHLLPLRNTLDKAHDGGRRRHGGGSGRRPTWRRRLRRGRFRTRRGSCPPPRRGAPLFGPLAAAHCGSSYRRGGSSGSLRGRLPAVLCLRRDGRAQRFGTPRQRRHHRRFLLQPCHLLLSDRVEEGAEQLVGILLLTAAEARRPHPYRVEQDTRVEGAPLGHPTPQARSTAATTPATRLFARTPRRPASRRRRLPRARHYLPQRSGDGPLTDGRRRAEQPIAQARQAQHILQRRVEKARVAQVDQPPWRRSHVEGVQSRRVEHPRR